MGGGCRVHLVLVEDHALDEYDLPSDKVVADMHNMGIWPPIMALGRKESEEVEKGKGTKGYGLKVGSGYLFLRKREIGIA